MCLGGPVRDTLFGSKMPKKSTRSRLLPKPSLRARRVALSACPAFVAVNCKNAPVKLSFIWDALSSQWEEGYEHLQAYVSENENCKVPHSYVSADGYRLGARVNKQRQKQNSMSIERKARLDALASSGTRMTLYGKKVLST
jgi:Helicase associated domain